MSIIHTWTIFKYISWVKSDKNVPRKFRNLITISVGREEKFWHENRDVPQNTEGLRTREARNLDLEK
jgi:hypothetical protein